MAFDLLFCDSCQHVAAADIALKWSSVGKAPTISATGSAFGKQCYHSVSSPGASLAYALGANLQDVGMALRLKLAATFQANALLIITDAGTTQVDLRVAANGSLSVTRNGTALANSGALILAPATYYHIEMIAHIANAGAPDGWVRVWVNEVLWVTFDGDTQATANAYATAAVFALYPTNARDFHDMTVRAGSGATTTSNWGDQRVDYQIPTGAGNYQQWTPSASTRLDCIDDAAPNTTDYNSDSVAADRDSFTFPALPTGAVVKGGQLVADVIKTDAGAHTLKLSSRESATDYDGAAKSITDTYRYHLLVLLTQGGGGAWDKTSWDAAEAGYKLES